MQRRQREHKKTDTHLLAVDTANQKTRLEAEALAGVHLAGREVAAVQAEVLDEDLRRAVGAVAHEPVAALAPGAEVLLWWGREGEASGRPSAIAHTHTILGLPTCLVTRRRNVQAARARVAAACLAAAVREVEVQEVSHLAFLSLCQVLDTAALREIAKFGRRFLEG